MGFAAWGKGGPSYCSPPAVHDSTEVLDAVIAVNRQRLSAIDRKRRLVTVNRRQMLANRCPPARNRQQPCSAPLRFRRTAFRQPFLLLH